MNIFLETYAISDTGRIRSNNEDCFGSFTGAYGNLFIVCDGIGGASGGEIASQLAVESIKNHFDLLDGNFNADLELNQSIIKANEAVLITAKSNHSLIEMGTTVTMLLIKESKAFTTNLGDSRIYLSRNGTIRQLTKDHSLVQQLIDKNQLREAEAKKHPKRNIITRSLGIGEEANPDITGPIDLQINDCFILCSDGLTSNVEDEEINKIALDSGAQETCNRLVELANERGGSDNITAIVVKVHKSV